jgi:threonyl-tRNA synthetase
MLTYADVCRYELVYSPHIANVELWKQSGHFEFYADGMFDQMDVENEVYQIKPMNCPFHVLMYKNAPRYERLHTLSVCWRMLAYAGVC